MRDRPPTRPRTRRTSERLWRRAIGSTRRVRRATSSTGRRFFRRRDNGSSRLAGLLPEQLLQVVREPRERDLPAADLERLPDAEYFDLSRRLQRAEGARGPVAFERAGGGDVDFDDRVAALLDTQD